MIGFLLCSYSTSNTCILTNCSFLSLESFVVTAFYIFRSIKPCFSKSCFTTCPDMSNPISLKAFERYSLSKAYSGVINKLFVNIIDGIKSVINKAGAGNNASLFRSVQTNMLIDFITKQGGLSTLDKDMNSYQTRLSELNEKYTAIQTRYYNKFTAMEQAISRANSQSSWLSQQLGGSAG